MRIATQDAGHHVLFATATDRVTRLHGAHHAGRLPQELTRLARYGLIIVHHADVITLKGSSCRLRDTDIDTLPCPAPRTPHHDQHARGLLFDQRNRPTSE